MPTTFPSIVYLVAGILFILSLRGLSTQSSAQRGNWLGVIGMVLAVQAVNQFNAMLSA